MCASLSLSLSPTACRYCRRVAASSVSCAGAHEGDLQVGWLHGADPVFLDSWVRSAEDDALCALYRVVVAAPDSYDGATSAREYLCEPFGPRSPAWLAHAEAEMTTEQFSSALAAQLPAHHRTAFKSIEALDAAAAADEREEHYSRGDGEPLASQSRVEVSPQGGTLVLFDAAAVPHEVLPTSRGTRLAVAGWFHVQQQRPPDWFG